MEPRKLLLLIAVALGLWCSCFNTHAQEGLVISEFLAMNSGTIRDDFGESSDYLEVYNGTPNAINLEGYYLTDSLSSNTQWQFPQTLLASGEHLLVWASGHDRRTVGQPLHTNFKLDGNGEVLALIKADGVTVVHQYVFGQQFLDRAFGLETEVLDTSVVLPRGAPARYIAPNSDSLRDLWNSADFDDTGWRLGTSALGFDTNPASGFPAWISTDVKDLLYGATPQRGGLFVRIPFVLERQDTLLNPILQIRYDDGFVAYLNGKEVARRGIATKSIPSFSTTSSLTRSNDVAIVAEDFASTWLTQGLRPGTNILAIHAFNRDPGDADFLIVPEMLSRRLRYRTNAERHFAIPSPSVANPIGYPGASSSLEFSVKSRTFLESFELVLTPTRPTPLADIRYTLDGSMPGADSIPYTGPMTITNSLQIRARLLEPGLLPGRVRTEAYARLSPEMASVSSDLPLILVHSYGVGTFNESTSKGCILFVHEPRRGRASFTNAPNAVFRAGLKLRGSSSVGNPKYNWAVDAWDEDNRDVALPLLGMPSGAEWVFHAPYITDSSLINNPLASEMSHAAGRYAPHYRSVELYLNQRPSGLSQATVAPTNYFGVYNILQRIGIGPNRVDIDKLTDQDVQAPEVTGGYLLNIDRNIDGPPGFTAGGQPMNYGEPSHDDMISPRREAQRTYLTSYLDRFAAVLNSPNWTNPVTGYAPYVDTGSWIDFHLVNIISVNGEVPGNSTFFYKPRGGPIVFGPIWDFDKAFAWTEARDNAPLSWDPGRGAFGAIWWGRLFQDPNFWQAYIDRFQELAAGPYGVPGMWSLIDRLSHHVRESAVRDMVRWKQPKRGGSQEGEIAYFKDWMSRRIRFMETNFLARPDILERGGQVTSGTSVTLEAPPGATIYFTLDGTDPRADHGSIASNASVYTGPIAITGEARLVARSRDEKHRNLSGGSNPPLSSPWSGPVTTRYILHAPATPQDLVVTELNYHPSAPTANELSAEANLSSEDFEFIEIQNTSHHTVDLFGSRFTQGVTFSFSNAATYTLEASARLLLVKNPAAMVVRYGLLKNIAGTYTGSLANAGQTLRLEDASGKPLFELAYESGWYPTTDGMGFTLVRRNSFPQNNAKEAWSPSTVMWGSPGLESLASAELPRVVINEVLANSASPLVDAIELLNLSGMPADISGWHLTDDPSQPRKYRIPDKTILPAGGFWVTNQTAFGQPSQGINSFGLSSHGDEVWLFASDRSGALLGYSHGFRFGPSEADASWGRHGPPNGEEQFVVQSVPTLGATNAGPKVGPVIFREILYHPPDLFENGSFWDDDENEYIEIQNVGNTPVSFTDPATGQPWRLRGTVDFDFTKHLVLAANESALLVSFDPTKEPARLAAWRQKWNLSASFPFLGPFRGRMENSGARLSLLKPFHVESENADVSYGVVDQVTYRDTAPWPAAADGGGAALQRKDRSLFGDDAENWTAALPSPGREQGSGSAPIINAQPAGQTLVSAARAVFKVTTAPGSAAWYQWRRDGANVPGGTNAQLVLDQVQEGDAGRYSVVLVNDNGSVESDPATLTVLRPATIIRQPEGQNLRPGSDARFTVAATGRGNLTFRWYFNGSLIPLATRSSFLLTNVQSTHTGAYSVQVTDSVGSSMSHVALLSVLVRPTFVTQPQSLVAIAGDSLELRVEVNGLSPFAYRWRKGATTLAGATNAVLALKNIQLSDAGTYLVNVTNLASGTLGTNSQTATLIVMSDSDRDRVGDEWETQFGYAPNLASDANLDDDGDGQTTLQEFIAGTDPRDVQSRLEVDSIHLSPHGTELSFMAQANRGYTAQFRESFDFGQWQTLKQVNGLGAARQEIVVDSAPPSAMRFYRVITPQLFENKGL